jgi:hypothetical protein
VLTQDYLDCREGFKQQSLCKAAANRVALRQNAVEESDVLFRFQKSRHSFELCAMLLRDEGRASNIASIGHLGGARVALEQNRLRSGAAGRRAEEKDAGYRPNFHNLEATSLDRNRKRRERRSLRSCVDQRFDQLDGVQ